MLDPQGKSAHHALGSLGFNGVNDVRIGKQIVLDVDSSVTADMIKEMCETLLANTVIEDYDFELKP